jgi:TolB-like protein/tetratricopeptide (TPR) repeat protein
MAQGKPGPKLGEGNANDSGLLDSWKEIAAYLNRTVRTAQRWEVKEHLPVRRHLHDRLGTVYAYASELDAWWKQRQPQLESTDRPDPLQDRVCLAVLPFENLSGDPDQEYFSDGLTEEMITQLGRLDPQRLGVIARTSVMPYRNTAKGIDCIARELGVDYVIEGSARRSADRVRITAQLIRARDQTHLLAETYERSTSDILSIQTEFAERVAQSFTIDLLSGGRLHAAPLPAMNPDAHEAYLKGRFWFNKRTEEGFLKAINHFRRAIEIDPQYAVAHAGLAEVFVVVGLYGMLPPKETYERAKAAAKSALQLDARIAEAHAALGFAKLRYEWDWKGAEADHLRAIELDANYATAHLWYGLFLAAMERFDEALAELKHARQIDPLAMATNAHLGWVLYLSRQYEQAAEQLGNSLEIEPNFPLARFFLGFAYEQQGRYTDAIGEFEKASQLTGGHPGALAGLGHAHALAGNRAEAQEYLARLERDAGRRYVSPYFIALVHVGLGDTDEAFRWLDTACEHRSDWLVHLKIEPALDPLRSDPRFDELVRRVGLPS